LIKGNYAGDVGHITATSGLKCKQNGLVCRIDSPVCEIHLAPTVGRISPECELVALGTAGCGHSDERDAHHVGRLREYLHSGKPSTPAGWRGRASQGRRTVRSRPDGPECSENGLRCSRKGRKIRLDRGRRDGARGGKSAHECSRSQRPPGMPSEDPRGGARSSAFATRSWDGRPPAS
jgi:hypothetical protein